MPAASQEPPSSQVCRSLLVEVALSSDLYCFLADTLEGEQALHGVYLAWTQRLMFTVGRSITTGRDNCVTWNDIHMKTNVIFLIILIHNPFKFKYFQPNGGEHGYPDPSYLKNLLEDLTGFGITDAAISEHQRKHPDLKTRGKL